MGPNESAEQDVLGTIAWKFHRRDEVCRVCPWLSAGSGGREVRMFWMCFGLLMAGFLQELWILWPKGRIRPGAVGWLGSPPVTSL